MKQRTTIAPIWLITLIPLLMAPTNCHGNNPPDAGPPVLVAGTGGTIPATGGSLGSGGALPASGGSVTSGGTSSTTATSGTGDACDAAGARLQALGCTQQKTPKGVSFATACHNAVDNGLNWHPECIAKVPKCSDVPAAYRGCKP